MPDGLTTWPTGSDGQQGFGVRNGANFNYWQSNGHGHGGVTLYDASGNVLFSKTPSDARATPTDAADVIASLVAYNGATEDRLRVDANKNLLVSETDGSNVTQGAIADAAVTTNTTGTLSGKLRGLVAIFADVWDSVNHFFGVSLKTLIEGENQTNHFLVTAPPQNTLTPANASPGYGSQATCNFPAAGAGIKNVCTSITVSLANDSTGSVTAGLQFNLINGTTGGTTYLWRIVMAVPATAGACQSATLPCWFPGSANTQMTLECIASLGAHTAASVSMSGCTIQ